MSFSKTRKLQNLQRGGCLPVVCEILYFMGITIIQKYYLQQRWPIHEGVIEHQDWVR